MAWDLWGPSYNQVAQDNNCYAQPDRQCYYYFDFGVDVLEENALNEKFCREVLRILITKADTEINELQKDLVAIQNELAWAEYEDWSEMCCSSFREKIDYLDISLKSLRKGKYEIDVDVLMHRKPAKEVHEIVKALLGNHSTKKDKQPLHVIVNDSSSNGSAQKADLNVILKEEVEELIIEKSPISYSSLKFQGEKTNSLEAKPTTTSVKHAAPDSLQLAAVYSEEKKISHNNSKLTTNNKANMQGSSYNDKGMIQSSILKPAQKLTNAVKDSGVTSNPHEMKKLCLSDMEVDGDKEVRKQCLGTKSESLSSPLCCSEGKECIPEAEINKQPAKAVVECDGAHPPKHAAYHGGKEGGSESRSGTFKVTENGSPNKEQKLRDFLLSLRSLPKDGVQVCTAKVDLISSLTTKRSKKDAEKVLETGLSNKHSGPISVQDLQDRREKGTFKPQSEEGTPPLLALHKAEIAANDSNPNLNASLKPQRRKAKRKPESNLPVMQEVRGLLKGVCLDELISKFKKRQKSEVSNDNVCLNQLFDRKILKKPVHTTQQGTKQNAPAGISINLPVQSERKTETGSSMPLLLEFKSSARNMDIKDSFGANIERASNEKISCSVDDCKANAATCLDLSNMKLVELKTIARQCKLPLYSKLKKEQLIKQLSDFMEL